MYACICTNTLSNSNKIMNKQLDDSNDSKSLRTLNKHALHYEELHKERWICELNNFLLSILNFVGRLQEKMIFEKFSHENSNKDKTIASQT